MPAPYAKQQVSQQALDIAAGNKFGRYKKINASQTFNMIVSDDWLVIYAGYKNVLTQSSNSAGRAIYASHTANSIFAVWGSNAYRIDEDFNAEFIGSLSSSTGDVFISENNNRQVVFTDYQHLYVYDYNTPLGTWKTSDTDFTVPFVKPGYVSFQNGRLIVVDSGTQKWYLSDINVATSWPNTGRYVGSFQTKPDTIQAAVPLPGGGNNILVFGHNVIEMWQDVGTALFPYQRQSTFNIDYGCLNASSIAALEDTVIWLSANEQSGATVMAYKGGSISSITTDGMDFQLANLTNPTNCTGFLFRQDGHLIYQFTFPDDNLSYIYDLETKLFFTVTDENLNYHIARNVVFFNNFYYFVSLRAGNLYEFGTQYTDFQYTDNRTEEIPRIRICSPFRLPDQRMFIIQDLSFTMENGRPNDIQKIESTTPVELVTQDGILLTAQDGTIFISQNNQVDNVVELASEAIDLSISRDGGETFGGSLRLNMNPYGKRRSRVIFRRLGQANDCTVQLRFWGFGRFVVSSGQLGIYQ